MFKDIISITNLNFEYFLETALLISNLEMVEASTMSIMCIIRGQNNPLLSLHKV